MLYDGIELTNASVATNLAIESGNDLPAGSQSTGELFYKLGTNEGLYVFNGTEWIRANGTGGGASAGNGVSLVQVGDGAGGFLGIPAPAEADLVLTSNSVGLPTWEPAQVSGGTVTSVSVNGGTTGLSFTGGPITNQGTITADGCLAIKNGGTGAVRIIWGTGKSFPYAAS